LLPQAKGATLRLGLEAGGVRLHLGAVSDEDYLPKQQLAASVPTEWQTVRVDATAEQAALLQKIAWKQYAGRPQE